MFPGSDKGSSGNYIFSIFEHIRQKLLKKGPKGLFYFFKSIKCNDYDNDGKLSSKEFIKSLKELRIELLEKEIFALMNTFDQNKTGFIIIDNFMEAFVPALPDTRLDIVDELTEKLATGGQVSFTKVKSCYNARGHPLSLIHI